MSFDSILLLHHLHFQISFFLLSLVQIYLMLLYYVKDKLFYFSTIENGLKYNLEPVGAPDIYHYDSDSMIKLGNLFGERLLTILK